MTDSTARWATREILALIGLIGFAFSVVLYLLGLLLAGVDALATLVAPEVPALLSTVGRLGVRFFLVAEGLLAVSGWLADRGAGSGASPPKGQKGKGAA